MPEMRIPGGMRVEASGEAEKVGCVKIRTAAYCRVSTEQEEQEGSYDVQMRYYREKIGLSPAMELVGLYGDRGKSGLHTSRPGLQKLLADCEAGKIDLILTKSVSRFARSMADCVDLIQRLRGWKVTVFFEREGLQTDNRRIDLFMSIFAALAQEESNSISQNAIRSHEQYASQGRPYGRVSYGYCRSGPRVWQTEPEEARRVRTAFRMAAQGRTYAEILTALNRLEQQQGTGVIWRQRRLRNMLRNVAYLGDYYSHSTVCLTPGHQVVNRGYRDRYYIEEHHEALVSRALFDQVQRAICSRRLCSGAARPERGDALRPDERWKRET